MKARDAKIEALVQKMNAAKGAEKTEGWAQWKGAALPSTTSPNNSGTGDQDGVVRLSATDSPVGRNPRA